MSKKERLCCEKCACVCVSCACMRVCVRTLCVHGCVWVCAHTVVTEWVRVCVYVLDIVFEWVQEREWQKERKTVKYCACVCVSECVFWVVVLVNVRAKGDQWERERDGKRETVKYCACVCKWSREERDVWRWEGLWQIIRWVSNVEPSGQKFRIKRKNKIIGFFGEKTKSFAIGKEKRRMCPIRRIHLVVVAAVSNLNWCFSWFIWFICSSPLACATDSESKVLRYSN